MHENLKPNTYRTCALTALAAAMTAIAVTITTLVGGYLLNEVAALLAGVQIATEDEWAACAKTVMLVTGCVLFAPLGTITAGYWLAYRSALKKEGGPDGR